MLKLACILSVIALACASDVLDLTDSTFSSEISGLDIALVEFYAPWCGHCKRLAPEYEAAATVLKKADTPVPLAKVDCTGNQDTCGKYGVSGYPTLKIFRNGEVAEDYNGPREKDGIVSYMKSKAGPSSKELVTVADAEKFLSSQEHGIVGFFEKDDSEIIKQFKKLADAMSEKFRFAHTTAADVLAKYSYKDDIVLFRPQVMKNKFEDNTVKYDGDAVLNNLKSWVTESAQGLCGHRTSSNQDQFKKPLFVAYFDVDYTKNPKGTNYWRNRVMKVGKKIRDSGKSVYFAISGAGDFGHELAEFGLTAKDGPVVAARDEQEQKFVMKDDFSMATFEKFVNDVLDGKVKPYLKSEPIPESNDAPVKVVVAEEFNDIVNNPEKDVLIEFYAPWCGHCKTLAPKYDELAEKLKDESGITIAKMDATANDVPKTFGVQGFPTLFFAPKGSKDSPKKYEGGREVDDFLKYLAREATDELKGYDRSGKKKKSEL